MDREFNSKSNVPPGTRDFGIEAFRHLLLFREVDTMSDTRYQNMPVALTIAGSDSGGGAGIQADLKTFAAFRVHGASAITCTTAQNPDGVISVQAMEVDHIRDQITQVLDYFDVRAIKTGMLYSEAIIRTVTDAIADHPDIPFVLDPVMVATSGATLLKPEAIDALKALLFPRATVITPNLDEGEVLIEHVSRDEAGMKQAACELAHRFDTACLLKGGHLNERELVDVLAFPDGRVVSFRTEKVDGVNSHGSGCTLASAIAANLAKGTSVAEAVKEAHHYLQRAFRNPLSLNDTFFLNHFV